MLQEDPKRSHVTARVDGETLRRIEGYAAEAGLSRSAAVCALVKKGLSADESAKETEGMIDARLGFFAKRLEASLSEAVERCMEKPAADISGAARDVSRVRNDAGKAAQAALAHLAFDMFTAHEAMRSLSRGQRTSMPGYMSRMRPRDIYAVFWNAGGMLRRNPAPAWFQNSFSRVEESVPGIDVEGFSGVPEDVWRKACEPPCKDSAKRGE